MNRTAPLILVVLIGMLGTASAERAALLPASGINVHEGYLQAVQSVTRDHLEQNGFQVAVVSGPPGSMEMSGAEAVAPAKAMGARFAVVVHITRLGAAAKVKLTAYDVTANVVAYRGSLTAATPDDIDVVMARLVKGMATGRPPEDTAEVDTVTEKDSDAYNKVHATSVFGVRLGGVMPLNGPDGAGEGLPGFGVFWLYDVRTFLADVAFDFHSNDDDDDITLAIGAYYPFSRSNTTPYVGGGLRYGMTDYGGEGATGIAGFGSVGVLFGRLSTVQLRGELSVFQNFFEEKEDAGSSTHNTGLMVSAGIGF